ncbi:MAG: hypothetical protein ACRDGR_09095 [bacterium]
MSEKRCLFACLILSALSASPASPAPPNDDFADAVPLAGPSDTTSGTNEGATREVGEPTIDGYEGGRSVWWRWTALEAEEVTVHTIGSDFDTILGVYTGTAVNALTLVDENDDPQDGEGLHSLVTFRAVAGKVYHFAVDGVDAGLGPESGRIVLSWRSGAPPNDLFEEGLPLDGPRGHTEAFSPSATRETGEPLIDANEGGRSVWWRWVAPRTERVTLLTFGSDFDTLLGVYTGTAVRSLTLIAENNDTEVGVRGVKVNSPGRPPCWPRGCGGPSPQDSSQSWVDFEATAGTLYHFVVDGFEGQSGYILLTWLSGPDLRPANDSFADRMRIEGPDGRLSGTSFEATMEIGEPDHAQSGGTASVWWSWVAPADGTLEIHTAGSTFDTVLAVYTGASLEGLVLVAENDDHGTDMTSAVRLRAEVGTEHQIAVNGFDGESGIVVLNWSFTPRPQNPGFIRGDCDGDGAIHIADALCTLAWLFQGGAQPECAAATNTDGGGGVDVSDAIHLLSHLFRGGPEPVAPFPECGIGTLAADEELGCRATQATCR